MVIDCEQLTGAHTLIQSHIVLQGSLQAAGVAHNEI